MSIYDGLARGDRLLIIAEIGSNHNGDMTLAKRMIEEAKAAGCDAVKFQSWEADTLRTKKMLDAEPDRVERGVEAKGLAAIQKRLALSREDHRSLKDHCDKNEILFCSTPFDRAQVDLLVGLGIPFLKAASMDLNNLGLLGYMARQGLPILLSIGMGDEREIRQAVQTIRDAGNEEIVLLHCVSVYPSDDDIVNLRTIQWLGETFGVPVGFSDHALGISLATASVALGARVIEKHFMLEGMPCRDAAVSLTPDQMKLMVEGARRTFRALGEKMRVLTDRERAAGQVMRRSIITARALPAGAIIGKDDIGFKRPGTAISPDRVDEIVGRRLKVDKGEEEMIQWDDLEG